MKIQKCVETMGHFKVLGDEGSWHKIKSVVSKIRLKIKKRNKKARNVGGGGGGGAKSRNPTP